MRARAAAAVLVAALAAALSWREPSGVYRVTASTLYGNVTPVMAYGRSSPPPAPVWGRRRIS